MHNKSTFYSFLFTSILLVSVFLSKADSDAKGNLTYQDGIKQTSLTASVALETNLLSTDEVNLDIAPKIKADNLLPVKENINYPENLKTTIAFAEDLSNKKALFSQNTDKHWAIASITKLMTALVALEKNELDKIITISQATIDTDLAINGNAENFSVGEKYTIGDLIRIMLTISSNKAAAAIAEFYGQKDFVNEMNAYAKKIGMSETNYYDCTGLSVSNQSTTDDLTKLAEYILANKPVIFDYTKLATMSALELNSNSVRTFENIDYFAGQPDFLGGKTGTIDASKQNLLSLFNYQNHKILIIILGSDNRFSDAQNILDWVKKYYQF